MPRKARPVPRLSFKRSPCPVTNTLDILGDKWTLLVVRDLFLGKFEVEGSLRHVPGSHLVGGTDGRFGLR